MWNESEVIPQNLVHESTVGVSRDARQLGNAFSGWDACFGCYFCVKVADAGGGVQRAVHEVMGGGQEQRSRCAVQKIHPGWSTGQEDAGGSMSGSSLSLLHRSTLNPLPIRQVALTPRSLPPRRRPLCPPSAPILRPPPQTAQTDSPPDSPIAIIQSLAAAFPSVAANLLPKTSFVPQIASGFFTLLERRGRGLLSPRTNSMQTLKAETLQQTTLTGGQLCNIWPVAMRDGNLDIPGCASARPRIVATSSCLDG